MLFWAGVIQSRSGFEHWKQSFHLYQVGKVYINTWSSFLLQSLKEVNEKAGADTVWAAQSQNALPLLHPSILILGIHSWSSHCT